MRIHTITIHALEDGDSGKVTHWYALCNCGNYRSANYGSDLTAKSMGAIHVLVPEGQPHHVTGDLDD